MRILMAETSWPTVTLAAALRDEGFLITTAEDGEDLLHSLELGEQDAMIFEDDLPDMSAVEALRRLRYRSPALPTVVLARAPGTERRLALMARGADLVIDSAMPPAELAARLRAMVRRRAGIASDRVALAGLEIDLTARRVLCRGRRLALTRLEYEIVEMMALRPGRIVPKETIMAQLYAWGEEPEARILDVYLCRIRKQIGLSGGDAGAIETHFGRGCRLATEPALPAAA